MKKTAILLSLLTVLLFSCKKEYKFFAFYINEIVSVNFPANSVAGFEILTDIAIGIDKILQENNTEKDLIQEITIEEINLSAADFSRFNSVDLSILTDNLAEETIAKSDTTEGVEPVSLNETNVPITDFITAPVFKLKTKGVLSGSYAQEFKINFNIRFLVKSYVK
jgi:hypothetical protein